jgi:hypothetical protein
LKRLDATGLIRKCSGFFHWATRQILSQRNNLPPTPG